MRQWRIAELLSRNRASVSRPFGNKTHNEHAKRQALVLSDQFPRRDPSIVPSEPMGRGCATWPFSLLNETFIDHLSALQAKSSSERAGFPFSPRGARNVDHFVHLWQPAQPIDATCAPTAYLSLVVLGRCVRKAC